MFRQIYLDYVLSIYSNEKAPLPKGAVAGGDWGFLQNYYCRDVIIAMNCKSIKK